MKLRKDLGVCEGATTTDGHTIDVIELDSVELEQERFAVRLSSRPQQII